MTRDPIRRMNRSRGRSRCLGRVSHWAWFWPFQIAPMHQQLAITKTRWSFRRSGPSPLSLPPLPPPPPAQTNEAPLHILHSFRSSPA